MNSTDKKIALLVHSCDRYKLLYKGFEYFFLKHWDFNASCNYYFATEEENVSIQGFTNIHSGKGEWSNRLAKLLRDDIKEDYILYFQEDMWLNKNTNGAIFNQLFDLSIQNNWKQVKLESSSVYHTVATPHTIEGFTIAQLDNQASGFLMSHQVGLWEKQHLLAQLKKDEHPWRNERKGTKRLKKLNIPIYHVDAFAENGAPPINNNSGPIGRSEYHTVSMNGMLNDRVMPYIDILLADTGDNKAYGEKLQYHYNNKLTHDGKPKPRKEDIFRKIKRWVTGR
jgi:hypothetical protein